jgi:hypothetical protein
LSVLCAIGKKKSIKSVDKIKKQSKARTTSKFKYKSDAETISA